MHDGCAGSFVNGMQVVDKIRMMGFAKMDMPMSMTIHCGNCGQDFLMEQYEAHCPGCEMVYGVTPCHAFDPANVMAAGIKY
jgi:hypothetical protein